jgi:hypothetical protein
MNTSTPSAPTLGATPSAPPSPHGTTNPIPTRTRPRTRTSNRHPDRPPSQHRGKAPNGCL